jgi:hypothetical protein
MSVASVASAETLLYDQSVDLNKIRHKAVKKFIHSNGLLQLDDFARLIHSCSTGADTKKFNRHIKIFQFSENLEKVWEAYKTIGPVETCTGSLLGFGLQYSRNNHRITYHEDDHGEIEAGQIIILNLRLLWNMISLAVGHEITEVNESEKYIKMCYLEGGASKGFQFIRLKQLEDGSTEVAHETFYKSNSDFRDKQLYPYLHGQVISEFHKNVEKKLAAG